MTDCAHCPEVKRLRKALLHAQREAESVASGVRRLRKACRVVQGGRTGRQPTQTSCGPERAVQGCVGAAAPGGQA